MKTYKLELTPSQAENLYFAVSYSAMSTLLSDQLNLYEPLEDLRILLSDNGFSISMK